jgi:hypothetical protein
MNCNDIRELLALQPSSADSSLQEHLDQCVYCANFSRRHQSFDGVLRAELHWEVPADLTARLLAIATAPVELLAAEPADTADILTPMWAVAMRPTGPMAQMPLARPHPKGWYVAAVYAITAAVIALSLLVALQIFSALTSQVSISATLTELLSLPGQGLSYLAAALPQSRYLIDFLMKLHEQLIWLLLVAVLWAALDKWNIPFNFGGPQQTS